MRFDLLHHVALQAEGEEDLGDEEDGGDEYLKQIVGERGLAPFEHVADELKDPASNEKYAGPGPARCDAGCGGELRSVEERANCDRRGESERHIEQKVVRENRAQENVREGHAFAQRYPSHRDQDSENDRGDTDEVREPVPAIAMVGGVERQLFLERFHAASGCRSELILRLAPHAFGSSSRFAFAFEGSIRLKAAIIQNFAVTPGASC